MLLTWVIASCSVSTFGTLSSVQKATERILANTIPNHLGVEYNARPLQTVAAHVAPVFGWEPDFARTGCAA